MTDPAARRWRLASPVTANVLGGVAVVVTAAAIGLDVLGMRGTSGRASGTSSSS